MTHNTEPQGLLVQHYEYLFQGRFSFWAVEPYTYGENPSQWQAVPANTVLFASVMVPCVRAHTRDVMSCIHHYAISLQASGHSASSRWASCRKAPR
mmetsp:Transcript_32977/g.75969  ORF Transcript_32977/g.75969 Transcript_32977/m.75969 type:complete len:96 (-) Transcript_32977:24-311(-)